MFEKAMPIPVSMASMGHMAFLPPRGVSPPRGAVLHPFSTEGIVDSREWGFMSVGALQDQLQPHEKESPTASLNSS